ncbi:MULTISPECIES: LysR family transcriptional regulator [unclassified Achromobacter]|uniref:LysR family transcriptional regulator n=1 Tax=unclassified Achromobacter TaxID=2626865 RepID=UPI000B514F43|nr:MULTISPECIES: LysR family transcriptional regulator [unclassified Achromobacter]OWT74891.1 LysR family transcriptional regulator [Achromobacter sp. HZ28]OWT76499.1 LysR family transcriptional regulator [Achromobacter sp. HZ34]
MKEINLSTRDLRAFLALAEQRSFTRAAVQCHLSQSAFSSLIRAIEDTLGYRLFDRNTRNVELTPQGQLLESSVRRMLNDFDEMIDDFRGHATLSKGRVSVAALPSIAAGWLPGIFAEFRQRYPAIDIELADVLSAPCLERVRTGRADFALASSGVQAQDLEARLLCNDRFHLVCKADHPLARQREIGLRDLSAAPFIHLARSHSVRLQLERAFHPYPMKTVMEVEQLATVTGMISAGIGITVVPALTLYEFERPDLVSRPLRMPGLVRRIYLVKRRGASLPAAAAQLYALMLERKPRRQATRARA